MAVALLAVAGGALPVAADQLFARFKDGAASLPTGESTAPGRAGWTDLFSFSTGAYVFAEFVAGQWNTAPVSLAGFNFTKAVDAQSPGLLAAMSGQDLFDELEVDYEITTDAGPLTRTRFVFHDVRINSYSLSGAPNSPAMVESVSCNFRSAYLQSLTPAADGTYTEHIGFMAYFDRGSQTGDYGPIDAPPGIGSVVPQTVARNSSDHSFNFTFADTDTPLVDLTVEVTSLSESLVPGASISLVRNAGLGTVHFDSSDATGTATLRISVADAITTVTRDVTVFVVDPSAPPAIHGPASLSGCVGEPQPFSGLAISDPDTSSGFQLVLSVDHGQLTLATDVPGGVQAGQVTGNGSGSVTVTADLSQINATLADPFGLLYATLTSTNAVLSIELADNDPPGSPVDSVGIPVVLYTDAFLCWQSQYFTPAEIAGNLDTGELADYDLDGIFNLIEFATGLNPTLPGDPVPMTVAISEIGGESFLTVTHNRRIVAGNLTYGLEMFDPVTRQWLDGDAGVSLVQDPVSVNPQIESVTYRVTDPLAGPATIVRLRVLRLPE